MSHYYYIRARNSPTSIGQDAESRPMLSINIEAMGDIASSLSWGNDIVSILASASIAVPSVDTFVGPVAKLGIETVGEGPITTVLPTGGSRSTITQDSRSPVLSAQIITRAADYNIAYTRANAIYTTLDGIYNRTV